MANKKRLIDANALLEMVQFRLPIDNKNAEIIAGCVDIARRYIENAPTVDAVEVVHGEWIEDYETFVDALGYESEPVQTGWFCSECGKDGGLPNWNYCPNCGADMRERKDNG